MARLTKIRAKEDLHNKGLCFKKDKIYYVDKTLSCHASLMDAIVINELGEKHIIGSWWRDFEIVQEEE